MDLNALIAGLAQNSHEAGQSAYGNAAAQNTAWQLSGLGSSLAGQAASTNHGTAVQNIGMCLGQQSQSNPSFPNAQAFHFDAAENRRRAHEDALTQMNFDSCEKYLPIFQLMGITLTAPVRFQAGGLGTVAHTNQWTMEIDIDGKRYRHIWDLLFNSTAEWDAEVGYLLDKVARLRKSLSPQSDEAELGCVLGRVP